MSRITRFIKLFFQYIGHVWYASEFKHSLYILHGTDSIKEHNAVKAHVDTLVKKVKKAKALKKTVVAPQVPVEQPAQAEVPAEQPATTEPTK